ncbi:MAG: Rrf2 family transcriptional regulator [Spirochaetaceae bacterium]|nr:Rrf2 family transcriptional regulator [Spirochaetaceae bacterium]
MKISTRGRYALRFMIDLAIHSQNQYIALKDISARQEISVKYLEQIASLLSKHGLLTSIRGQQGGYKLSRSPEKYSVGEILRLTEGPLAPVACLENPDMPCERLGVCKTLPFWKGLYKVIEDYVDKFTLEDLVNQEPLAE